MQGDFAVLDTNGNIQYEFKRITNSYSLTCEHFEIMLLKIQ